MSKDPNSQSGTSLDGSEGGPSAVKVKAPANEDGIVYDAAERPILPPPSPPKPQLASKYHNERIAHATDERIIQLAATQKVYRHAVRAFDIYNGPVLCATVKDKPGYLWESVSTQACDARQHSFVDLVHHDGGSAERIQQLLRVCETFDQFVQRLISRGYDVAAAAPIDTRVPSGRAWRLYDGSDLIGCLWDYPGQVCNLAWQSLPTESKHSEITLCCYNHEEDRHYANFARLFASSSNIQGIRLSLEARGYILSPVLYNPF